MLITIPGRPIPALRMTQKSKWSTQAKRYLAYKDLIGTIARKQYNNPTDQRVQVRVVAYLSGKSTPMGNDGDVDNYLKSALDGLNKIAFVDDRQVMSAMVHKVACNEEYQRLDIYIELY